MLKSDKECAAWFEIEFKFQARYKEDMNWFGKPRIKINKLMLSYMVESTDGKW